MPSGELTIDRRMMRYMSRLSFRQFIKAKPTRLGRKAFMLSDRKDGYVENLRVYSGANNYVRASVTEGMT